MISYRYAWICRGKAKEQSCKLRILVPGKPAIELEAASLDDAESWGCALEDVCSMLAVSLCSLRKYIA
jgi:hypothetical protein